MYTQEQIDRAIATLAAAGLIVSTFKGREWTNGYAAALSIVNDALEEIKKIDEAK